MSDLRFAIFGTGFWARFQLAAWRELEGARCVALYNRTRSRALTLAKDFDIPQDAVYDDAETLLTQVDLDFCDIITDNSTHEHFTKLCARHGRAVICQKPFADSIAQAESMLAACEQAGVPLMIHENWRWQSSFRVLKRELDHGVIGRVFRARVHYCNSFPVFENQPFLKELDRFILMDIGTHILDATRFHVGDAGSVVCQTQSINPGIKGEDVATAMLAMRSGATVTCEMSYASRTEIERFPQTYIYIEGDRGFLELGPDYWIRTTTENGTQSRRHPPTFYDWADPKYDAIHAAIVACNRDCLRSLQTGQPAETSAQDNLQTLRLVHACYASAEKQAVVIL